MSNLEPPLIFVISEPVGSPTANEVAYRLADHGVRTWIGSLAPAGELDEAALDALNSSVAALLIFDEAAAQSPHVERHLLVARQTGKPLIPLRVQDTSDEGRLREGLTGARWITWAVPEAAIEEIRRRIQVGDYATSLSNLSLKERDDASLPLPTPAASAALVTPLGSERTGYEAGKKAHSASPTALVAMLALFVIAGALLIAPLYQADDEPAVRDIATSPQAPVALNDRSSGSETSAPRGAVVAAELETPFVVDREAPLNIPSVPDPNQERSLAAPQSQLSAEDGDQLPVPDPRTPSSGASAVAAVQAFYSALSAGDGASAAQLVVPSKRVSGPLSGPALTRYYSSFRRPLRVRGVSPVDADTVRVAYDYVLADGRLCEGEASVDVVEHDRGLLVSEIRTRGRC